jgi:hypothetical protein
VITKTSNLTRTKLKLVFLLYILPTLPYSTLTLLWPTYLTLPTTTLCAHLPISGESGAGKTENTKKVIMYFANVAAATIIKVEEDSAAKKVDTLPEQ